MKSKLHDLSLYINYGGIIMLILLPIILLILLPTIKLIAYIIGLNILTFTTIFTTILFIFIFSYITTIVGYYMHKYTK